MDVAQTGAASDFDPGQERGDLRTFRRRFQLEPGPRAVVVRSFRCRGHTGRDRVRGSGAG